MGMIERKKVRIRLVLIVAFMLGGGSAALGGALTATMVQHPALHLAGA
ncbi:MAG: hypothetical protein JWO25_535 [Alphaproteobacteria bacterium]|nr:hypothetical protein [Alphaproteobacteria bacterium]MDB5722807.1 hypothetical protein [Alphaproteobacteria bacterium]